MYLVRMRIRDNWVLWICILLMFIALIIMILSFLELFLSLVPEAVKFLF